MNGIELLQKTKSHPSVSHVPFVLLTAKTTIESKLQGLTHGADDYITKPFNVQYFQARISNLIEQRNRLQEIYFSNLLSGNKHEFYPHPYIVVPHDENLMQSVLKILDENIANRNFTVDDLAVALKISRSVLFKKIKGLTGYSPIDFIRNLKMKRASQLILTGEYMVKEVAGLVGISDTKYFTKCFKTAFGMTPADYKNIKNKL
jgi:YesN/AraC family two-component response regulator